MPGQRRLPGLGLWGFWILRANDWKPDMDENLLRLSTLVAGSVASRTADLPSSPADGFVAIVKNAVTNAKKIAIRDAGAWTYLDPKAGMRLWCVDTGTFAYYNGTDWITEDATEVHSILALDDVPNSFGTPGQIMAVNGAGNAIVFIDQPTDGGGPGGSGGGVEEAPEDGKLYSRKDGDWAELPDAFTERQTFKSYRMRWTNPNPSGSVASIAELWLKKAGVRLTGGTAFASSFYGGGYEADKALDDNDGTYWFSSDSAILNAYVGATYATPQEIDSISIKAAGPGGSNRGNYAPLGFTIDGTNDDPAGAAAWTNVFTSPTQTAWADMEERNFPIELPFAQDAPDAPVDGKFYGRKNGGWLESAPVVSITQAAYDALATKDPAVLYAVKQVDGTTFKLRLGTLALAV